MIVFYQGLHHLAFVRIYFPPLSRWVPYLVRLLVKVSCTVTFDPETEGQHLAHALDYFQYQLKGVSFLPRVGHGAFAQV